MQSYLFKFKNLLVSFLLFCLAGLPYQNLLAGEDDSSLEPQITIRHEEEKTFYEYRVNGILKEIKVIPQIGPTYYLIPADGSGWIKEDSSQLLVPSWVLFKW